MTIQVSNPPLTTKSACPIYQDIYGGVLRKHYGLKPGIIEKSGGSVKVSYMFAWAMSMGYNPKTSTYASMAPSNNSKIYAV